MTGRMCRKGAAGGLVAMWTIGCSAAAAMALFITGEPAKAEHHEATQVLVLSKTAGYRHASIPAGQAEILRIAREQGISVTFTEDATLFTDESLARFGAVIFLNTTGDVLNPDQQASFERYIGEGHGLLGIHAATDTETDGKWPWFNRLIGAKFKSHPPVQEAQLLPVGEATQAIRHTDEWYDFKDAEPGRVPLMMIDRKSYDGSTANGIEPIVWTNEVDGARAYYIGMGHTDESYESPVMHAYMTEGLLYALGD